MHEGKSNAYRNGFHAGMSFKMYSSGNYVENSTGNVVDGSTYRENPYVKETQNIDHGDWELGFTDGMDAKPWDNA